MNSQIPIPGRVPQMVPPPAMFYGGGPRPGGIPNMPPPYYTGANGVGVAPNALPRRGIPHMGPMSHPQGRKNMQHMDSFGNAGRQSKGKPKKKKKKPKSKSKAQ